MLGNLNHVAVAVSDLDEAVSFYRDTLGMFVSDPKDLPEHGVTVSVVRFPNMVMELLYPLGDNSPIAKFLERNPKGGMHHVSFEVDNIPQTVKDLTAKGVSLVGDGTPKIGFHGTPVVFLKPVNGVLIELEETRHVTENMGIPSQHTPFPSSKPPYDSRGVEPIQITFGTNLEED